MESSYFDETQTGETKAPWVQWRESLTTVRIEYGVENIGDYAFRYYVSDSD